MPQPTVAQLREARRLIQLIVARRQHLGNLKSLTDAAVVQADTQNDARWARTAFAAKPELLAGSVALHARTDPETRRMIEGRYLDLLRNMHEAPAPGIKPYRVDFDALPPEARPYLLAPYLGLVVGNSFPRLCLKRSAPERGRLTFVVSGGPVDLTDWRPHLSAVDAWLGGNWTIENHTATTVSLIRRDPLPDIIPFDPAMLKAGHLFLGIDVETRKPFHVPLSEMTHTLVCGTTGMGKSNGLHVLVRSLLHNIDHFTAVHLVCGKGGVAFRRYTGIHPKVKTYSEPEELWQLTQELVAEMKTRNARMAREGRENTHDGFIALVIDEFGAFNTSDTADRKSAKYKAHEAFMANMMHLGKRGRSTGIRLVLTVQEPTERDISTGIKSVLPTVMAYRLPMVQHATSVFGELQGLPMDPRLLPIATVLHRSPNLPEPLPLKVPNLS